MKELRKNSSRAVLQTIIYSDIFDFPLTKEEILNSSEFMVHGFGKIIKELKGEILYKYGFYYLKGREAIIAKRLEREKISQKKLIKAKFVTKLLRFIPTIQLIGLSGSLAMMNADNDEDIDFCIITKHNTIWITRLLSLVLLRTLGIGRKRNDKHVSNKICINMFVDQAYVALPKNKQNLYTAHEVLQLKPLFARNNAYEKFIRANSWTKKFLPNWSIKWVQSSHITLMIRIIRVTTLLAWLFEPLAKKVQVWYMRKQNDQEEANDTMLAFYPSDRSDIIMARFRRRYKEYDI